MSKGLRYWGEFLTVKSRTVRIEIWKEDFAGEAEELRFPADDPLVIEWAEADKLEPVLSSSATLKIESESDRQFLDELYTVEAGSVILKVYIGGSLYWSGSLDTELYEEPYSMLKGYDVTVTFQDFAILDRLKYDRSDTCSIKDLIEFCIGKAQLAFGSLDWDIAITDEDGRDTDLSDAFVRSANWYDEEGEAMTIREVLDNVLKVFSLRLQQKAGDLHIYDLHSLHGKLPETVEWSGNDSFVSTDKVYNDIEVSWSTYSPDSLMDGSVRYKGAGQADEIAIQYPMNDEIDGDVAERYLKDHDDTTASLPASWPVSGVGYGYIIKNREGFILKTSSSGSGLIAGPDSRYFEVQPMYSGTNIQGIVMMVARHDMESTYHGWGITRHWHSANIKVDTSRPRVGGLPQTFAMSSVAASTRRFYIPAIKGSAKYYLRLKVDMVIDSRINPFESSERGFVQDYECCDHVYVPFNFEIEGDDGVTRVWSNVSDLEMKQVIKGRDNWVVKTSAVGYKFSQFYGLLHFCSNMSSVKDSDGHLGRCTNKPFEGKLAAETPDSIVKLGDGDYLALPDVGGWATISISNAIDSFDCNGEHEGEIRNQLGWFMLTGISLEVVDEYGNKVEESDYVTKTTLNRSAKEKLTIDTVLDVSDSVLNNANGLILDRFGKSYDGFCRNGIKGSLSELMCNTAYSQYSQRKLILSGTAELVDTFAPLSDRATPGKFVMLGETQTIRAEESQIKMVQFERDNYCPTIKEAE